MIAAQNVERWRKLPYLNDYQDPGAPKPGATVLAQMMARADDAAAGDAELRARADGGAGDVGDVALADEFGAGRSFARSVLAAAAALAGGGFAGAGGGDDAAADADGRGQVQMTAVVRDRSSTPAADAQVTAHVIGPEG